MITFSMIWYTGALLPGGDLRSAKEQQVRRRMLVDWEIHHTLLFEIWDQSALYISDSHSSIFCPIQCFSCLGSPGWVCVLRPGLFVTSSLRAVSMHLYTLCFHLFSPCIMLFSCPVSRLGQKLFFQIVHQYFNSEEITLNFQTVFLIRRRSSSISKLHF